MTTANLTLSILPDRLAICRLEPSDPIPEWAACGGFVSITRTVEELSIVCSDSIVPDGTRRERIWRGFKVQGPLDFSLTGILASLAVPLAEAKIGIFALSTFDTDYLLVKECDLARAASVLKESGHRILFSECL